MNQACIHQQSGVEMFLFALPYLGDYLLCWDCRRELVLRTHSFKAVPGLVPVCGGTIGYRCCKCGAEYTATDAMKCKCKARRAQCKANREAYEAWREYAKLCVWKPETKREAKSAEA